MPLVRLARHARRSVYRGSCKGNAITRKSAPVAARRVTARVGWFQFQSIVFSTDPGILSSLVASPDSITGLGDISVIMATFASIKAQAAAAGKEIDEVTIAFTLGYVAGRAAAQTQTHFLGTYGDGLDWRAFLLHAVPAVCAAPHLWRFLRPAVSAGLSQRHADASLPSCSVRQ